MKRQKNIINNLFCMCRDIDTDYRFKIYACIEYKRKIIAYGYNELKSHPFQDRWSRNNHSSYWHAETRAIYNALKIIPEKELRNCNLYVARCKKTVYNSLEYGISKPCSGCMRAIRYYGIKNVFYTLDGNGIGIL